MSIQLPSYTISSESSTPKNSGKVLLIIVSIASLLIGYFFSKQTFDNSLNTINERNTVLEHLNAENQAEISNQKTEVSLLTTELKVKKEAISQMQYDYKKLIGEKKELQGDINFYQRLLSPNLENKGLRVFEATINKQNNTYHLALILVQKLERAREIMGTYSVEIIGTLNKETKTIEISKKDADKFTFKYFHNISLNISLPEGFKAEQLVVKLFPKTKKAKTVEYKAVWHSLIK